MLVNQYRLTSFCAIHVSETICLYLDQCLFKNSVKIFKNARSIHCLWSHGDPLVKGMLLFIHWVMSDSLWLHGLHHARLLCPPLSPLKLQISSQSPRLECERASLLVDGGSPTIRATERYTKDTLKLAPKQLPWQRFPQNTQNGKLHWIAKWRTKGSNHSDRKSVV